jgi:hypothetical protein
MADITPSEICSMLSMVLESMPREVQAAFKMSEPKFMHIPTSFDMEKSIQRLKEFKESIPDRVPDLLASSFLFRLSRELPTTIRNHVDKTLKILNGQVSEFSKQLSTNDLLYMVRVWAFFSEKSNGVSEFCKHYWKEMNEILKTNPSNKTSIYQCILFHFRADDDRFDIKKGICIRRLYPWEYSEQILEILKARHWLKPPAFETLADANFILEVDSSILEGKDDWAKLHDLRRLVDIISVASKGHIWTPFFTLQKETFTQWNEGVKGSDFSGLIGAVPHKQKSIFINRIRKGLGIRSNSVFESVCRSLRQEEEDYGLEFRLVRLLSSLEILVSSPGIGCGMKLSWLLAKEPKLRKEIFEEFKHIKDLREKIIHQVLLYDLMTLKEKSDVLNSIHRLHDWLFNAMEDFLDSGFTLKNWQKDLSIRLFGGKIP